MVRSSPAVIEVRDLAKTYRSRSAIPALQGVTFRVARGEFVAVTGPSGSGKSTLLSLLGCLDRPSSGSYCFAGQDVSTLNETALARIRNQLIGTVFQNFNLLPRLTNAANVALPLVYAGVSAKQRNARALELIDRLGLAPLAPARPTELSGGQQQRIAIARALANDPQLLLADEPTGNLDSQAADDIMNLIVELNAKSGLTVVLVTHDPRVAQRAERRLHIVDGCLRHDERIAGAA